MKLNSKYFDSIRVKPEEDRLLRENVPQCDWPDCSADGSHKAPKGRDSEGQFFMFCVNHVREYNKNYNYFSGMKDDEMRAWQKQSQTGHRPTWKLGQNSWAMKNGGRSQRSGASRANAQIEDPFEVIGEGPSAVPRKTRQVRNLELKSLHELGLEENATPEEVKTQYKKLVKRLHPDANAGSRANEDKLREIIRAYDYLRSSGFC